MKAIVIHETGDPSVLKYEDVPTPSPKADEVLVKAVAIGVNRPELQVRRGVYPWMPPLPTIPGIELTGHIVEVGENIDKAVLGQAVFVSARDLPQRAGCYAEYISVPFSAAHFLPAGCDLDAAACLSNYQVAHLLLSSAIGTSQVKSAFVGAAASGIGSALVQLAKLKGLTVFASVSSDRKAAAVSPLGADRVVLTAAETWRDDLLADQTFPGADLVFDAVGSDELLQSFRLLADFGKVVSYGRLAGRKQGDIYEAMFENQYKNPSFMFFTMHGFDKKPDVRKEAVNYIASHLEAGNIKPLIYAKVPLEEAHRAHEMMESRENVGKIILKP